MPTQAMMYANVLSADAANVPPLANLPLPSRELLKERFYRFYVCNRPRPPASCLDAVTSTPGCGEPFWACGSCPRDSSPLILPAIARSELDCQKAPNEPLCQAATEAAPEGAVEVGLAMEVVGRVEAAKEKEGMAAARAAAARAAVVMDREAGAGGWADPEAAEVEEACVAVQ